MDASVQTAAEQKAFYDEQGYLVFPQLLDPDELATLRAAFAEVVANVSAQTEPDENILRVPDDEGTQHLVRILHAHTYHQAFHDLLFNPKILDILENLIGPNINLRESTLNLKPPSKFSAWLWHQDYPFFPHTNYDLIAVMVFLDDATPDNGCLTVIPGSHKAGPRFHDIPVGEQWRLKDRDELQNRATWQELPVPAGGLELHHCNLLHGSKSGQSDKPRSAVVIWYRASDNYPLGKPETHAGYGMQIRGADPGVVRMVGGEVRLPHTERRTPAPAGS